MGTGFSRYVAIAENKKEALILEQEAKPRKLEGEVKRKISDYTFKEVMRCGGKRSTLYLANMSLKYLL